MSEPVGLIERHYGRFETSTLINLYRNSIPDSSDSELLKKILLNRGLSEEQLASHLTSRQAPAPGSPDVGSPGEFEIRNQSGAKKFSILIVALILVVDVILIAVAVMIYRYLT